MNMDIAKIDELIIMFENLMNDIPKNISDSELFINKNFIKANLIVDIFRKYYNNEKDNLSPEIIEKLKKVITI